MSGKDGIGSHYPTQMLGFAIDDPEGFSLFTGEVPIANVDRSRKIIADKLPPLCERLKRK